MSEYASTAPLAAAGTAAQPAAVPAAGAAPQAPAPAVSLAPFTWWALVPGAVVFAVLMALSGRYGFHGDELYMLDCARHLAASYVDQPVFAPLMAWVTLHLFGVSLPGLRLWAALAAAGTVTIGGLTAREFGGGRRAQVLAASLTAVMPVVLGSSHIANTTPYMITATAGLGLVAARIGRTGDPRWWLAAGAVTGVGAEDNHQVAILAVALTICALATRGGRRLVFSWWFLGGAAIAASLEAPDLWWQATHEWAAIAMTHSLNGENGGLAGLVTWIPGQLGVTALASVPVWIAGLRFLWKSQRPLWRPMGFAWALLFVVFALTTGKQIYYLGGVYVYLLAAGTVALDGWLRARPGRLRRLLAATAVTGAAATLFTLPLLPPGDTSWTYKANTSLGEQTNAAPVVSTVAGVWRSLTPAQRAGAVLYTGTYTEAAAINELGRGDGLPTAVSAHNADWWWGPGNPDATTVVAVTPGGFTTSAAYLRQYFTSVRVVATVTNPYGIPTQDDGGKVYLCTGPRQPWGQLWPRLRHYD